MKRRVVYNRRVKERHRQGEMGGKPETPTVLLIRPLGAHCAPKMASSPSPPPELKLLSFGVVNLRDLRQALAG